MRLLRCILVAGALANWSAAAAQAQSIRLVYHPAISGSDTTIPSKVSIEPTTDPNQALFFIAETRQGTPPVWPKCGSASCLELATASDVATLRSDFNQLKTDVQNTFAGQAPSTQPDSSVVAMTQELDQLRMEVAALKARLDALESRGIK